MGKGTNSALFQVQGHTTSEYAILLGIFAVSPLQTICPDDHGFTIHYRAAQADEELIILIGKAFDVELFIGEVLALQADLVEPIATFQPRLVLMADDGRSEG